MAFNLREALGSLNPAAARKSRVPVWGFAEDGKTVVATHFLEKDGKGRLVMVQAPKHDDVAEMYRIAQGENPTNPRTVRKRFGR